MFLAVVGVQSVLQRTRLATFCSTLTLFIILVLHQLMAFYFFFSEEVELQLVTELVAQHAAAEDEQPIYGEMWTYSSNYSSLLNSFPRMVSC